MKKVFVPSLPSLQQSSRF